MNNTTLDKLYKPVTKKERQGPGGKMYAYTPSQDVIDRMNRTFKGNWSTNVTHQEVLEDQVLIRVTVTATDPEDELSRSYSHDGFGSSLIARYSYGDNKGKAMDIGNIFKSAEAKAIVNACKRFGVSLLDEEQGQTSSAPSNVAIPDGFIGHETAPAPETPRPTEQVITPFELDMRKVEEMKASMPSITPPSKNIEPVAPVTPAPVIPVPENTVGKPSAQDDLFPKPDTEDAPQPEAQLAGHLEPDKPGTMSDVQLAAIKFRIEQNGFNYQELTQEAFAQAGLPTDNIPEKEDLSYNQAVIIIKYSNEKQRQNM